MYHKCPHSASEFCNVPTMRKLEKRSMRHIACIVRQLLWEQKTCKNLNTHYCLRAKYENCLSPQCKCKMIGPTTIVMLVCMYVCMYVCFYMTDIVGTTLILHTYVVGTVNFVGTYIWSPQRFASRSTYNFAGDHIYPSSH